jgi:hypothetical protein
MTHIGVTYFHRVPPPFVDLARGCSPHDIVKEHVAVGFANFKKTEVQHLAAKLTMHC